MFGPSHQIRPVSITMNGPVATFCGLSGGLDPDWTLLIHLAAIWDGGIQIRSGLNSFQVTTAITS